MWMAIQILRPVAEVHLQLTPLESAILKRLRQQDSGPRQASVHDIAVISRELTPCGRYVNLAGRGLHPGSIQLNMVGIADGITVDLRPAAPGTWLLEIVVNGGGAWDGREQAFEFV